LVRKWSLSSIALVVELEAFDIVNRRNFHFVMPSFNSTNFFFISNLNCDGALHIKMVSLFLWQGFKIMFIWTLQRQYCLKTDLIQFIAFLEGENSLQNYVICLEFLKKAIISLIFDHLSTINYLRLFFEQIHSFFQILRRSCSAFEYFSPWLSIYGYRFWTVLAARHFSQHGWREGSTKHQKNMWHMSLMM